MGTMTVQNFRDYALTTLGTDNMEIPDTVTTVWINEAINHIQALFEPWHFYEIQYPLSTATQANKFSSIVTNSQTLETITAVQGDHFTLRYLPHDTAVKKYAWGIWTGRPFEYSTQADTLFLWPSPDVSYTYTIWGYRAPTPALLNTDVADLPNAFDPLIAEWVLARGYEFEDDNVMSTNKFNRFEQQLLGLRRRYKRAPESGINSIGQNHDGVLALPGRLAYDWESRSP